MHPARALAATLAGVLLVGLTACTGDDDRPAPAAASPSPVGSVGSVVGEPETGTRGDRDDRAEQRERDDASIDPEDVSYDVALSTPREDSVYPDVGDPGVDALHYGLDLTWDSDSRVLDGVATIVLRATDDAEQLRLDLGASLDLGVVTLDGERAVARHEGKDLVVLEPVRRDERHVLRVEYSGTPRPTAAPTTRGDFATTGFTVTDTGEVWTMQEPYGAYTWYPVNDQPSDKALYDVTVHAPGDWVGVSNGELRERTTTGRGDAAVTTTRWHLSAPAASYLVTLAIGAYDETTDTSASGVPISYWTPRDQPGLVDGLRSTPAALAWLEQRLGPYPFDTVGIVLVDSASGMETQTMITLGIGDYTTSPAVVLHELAHQWYGDQVTPEDWRDVWMNEGMAMYLQAVWQSEDEGTDVLAELARREPRERRLAGPPAAYDPATFGESNIYYGPALMWRAVRERIGAERFDALVREWPAARDDTSTGREDYLPWLRERTGLPASFFDSWLLAPTSPLT